MQKYSGDRSGERYRRRRKESYHSEYEENGLWSVLGPILGCIRQYPAVFILAFAAIWLFWPKSPARLSFSADGVQVEEGFDYRVGSLSSLEIYPFMYQRRMIGMPEQAGVSGALYYVTRADLQKARAQYSKSGGCWARTFSAYKKELMIVGSDRSIRSLVQHEGPPPLSPEPEFVKVQGSYLFLRTTGEQAAQANQVLAMRGAQLFLPDHVG